VFDAVFQKMQCSGSADKGFVVVPKEQADLDVEIEDGYVVFNILNPQVTKFGLFRMPFRLNPHVDDVYPVVAAAADYHWHLNRTQKKETFQNKVRVEFLKLKQDDEEFDENFNLIIRPDGPNLNMGGVVDIIVDKDAIYGINIINDTPLGLYPSLFFFDNSDLSISECLGLTERS